MVSEKLNLYYKAKKMAYDLVIEEYCQYSGITYVELFDWIRQGMLDWDLIVHDTFSKSIIIYQDLLKKSLEEQKI